MLKCGEKLKKTFLLQIDTVLLKSNRGTLSVDRNCLSFNFYVFFNLNPTNPELSSKTRLCLIYIDINLKSLLSYINEMATKTLIDDSFIKRVLYPLQAQVFHRIQL